MRGTIWQHQIHGQVVLGVFIVHVLVVLRSKFDQLIYILAVIHSYTSLIEQVERVRDVFPSLVGA